ncbi:MAG: hypothetical protein K5849_04165 [Bacteroidales bacterium]|nr:hypothetical protein [Bacteroidales bacterium]
MADVPDPIAYSPVYSGKTDIYQLPDLAARPVDAARLRELGVSVSPSAETMAALEQGSRLFARRLQERTLLPRPRYQLQEIDPAAVRTEIHNYTGHCPTLTFEINPVRGCGVGCQYCLVTDGVHEQPLVALDNYHLYVRRLLAEKNGPGSENRPHYYYFSPKTEAFQEATLLTGIAHRILREFIAHFRACPDSRARLFIASKAGAEHLLIEDGGESVLDLFGQLRDRMQFNTSVSIMPDDFRTLLEPFAAPLSERMRAVRLCRERGIRADSALVQPILTPWLTEEHIHSFFDALHEVGIINYKPEFLTACMENLAMLGPLLGRFGSDLERQLYDAYLPPSNADHRKQRGRTAPDRALSRASLAKMRAYTDTLGMSISICYWVRLQLGITEQEIPLINRNGFQCLGYQSTLFQDV